MRSLLPALAFAAVVAAQVASIIAASAVRTDGPHDRAPARATPPTGRRKAEYRA